MNSIKFPDIFSGSSTAVVQGREASAQDLKLLLRSEKGELFGDPFFGILIKRYMFDQNSYILRDVLIDEIYTQIRAFAPQIEVNRNDIKLVQEGAKIIAKIKCINREDFTPDMYDLVIFQDEER